MEFFYVKEIAASISIVSFIVLLINRVIRNRQQRRNEVDLSDFFEDTENIREYKKNYIKTHCVDRPPDEEDEPKESYESSNRKDLLDFFENQVFETSSKKLYLVLGDAGMGKTTFMINLFLRYNSRKLRRKYKIKYVPLSDPDADNFIQAYKDDGSINKDGSETILLLDAFDEDSLALDNYDARLNDIVSNVRTFRKVIITSRTQFFPEEEKEKFSLVIPTTNKNPTQRKFIKKYIAPFTDEEINKYLKKKYGPKFRLLGRQIYFHSLRRKAESIINLASSLMARPMLLDNIDLIITSDRTYNFEFEVYEEAINGWIIREGKKQPNKTKENFGDEMKKFIFEAARNVYQNFRDGNGLFIELKLIDQIAESKDIDLDKIDLSTRSLLNRNTKGRLKFSHKSILEYILARLDSTSYAEHNIIDFKSFDFGRMMRDQIVFDWLTNQRVFCGTSADGSDEAFRKLQNEHFERYMDSTSILAIGFREIEIRIFRLFPRLKKLYITKHFDCGKSEIITKRVVIATRGDDTSKHEVIKYHDGQIRVSPRKYKGDEFFSKQGIEVYWLDRIQ